MPELAALAASPSSLRGPWEHASSRPLRVTASTSLAGSVRTVDVVLDTIGGETQQMSFGVLRAGGALLATSAPPEKSLAKAHHVKATFVFHISDGSRLAKVVESVDAGTKILVDCTVPLDSLDEAFARQASGRARGKILLFDQARS